MIHCVLLVLLATAATFVRGNNLGEKHRLTVHSRFLPNIPKPTAPYAHEHHEKHHYVGALQKPTFKQTNSVESKVASIYKRQIHEISKTLESAKHHKMSVAETFQKVRKARKMFCKNVLSEHPVTEHKEIQRLLLERFSRSSTSSTSIGHDVPTANLRRRTSTNDPCMDTLAGNPEASDPDIAGTLCVMNFGRSGDATHRFEGKFSGVDPCTQCAAPGQLCHEVQACNDYLSACTTLDKDQKLAAKAEFDNAKNAILEKRRSALSAELDESWWDTVNDHPCNLVNTCPEVRGDEQRNEACERAINEYCCDPESSDCSLIERTSCSPAGCSAATRMYENVDHLWWESGEEYWRREHWRVEGYWRNN